jgi:hypothetical protein
MFYEVEKTARPLVALLAAHILSLVISIGVYICAIAYPSVLEVGDFDLAPIDWVVLASTMVFIPAAVLTLRWMFQVNANAQRLADGMTISPGWNVGWFFVPIANLWKPLVGLLETWAISRSPEGWRSVPTPVVLWAWWSFWVLAMILDYTLTRLTWNASSVDESVRYLPLDIADAAAWAVCSALLIRIVCTLSRTQAQTIVRHTFA